MPNIFDGTEDMIDNNEEESKANWEAWKEHEELIDSSFGLLHNFITAVVDQFKGSETCSSCNCYKGVHIPEGFKELVLNHEHDIKDNLDTISRGYRTNQQAMFQLMSSSKPSNN